MVQIIIWKIKRYRKEYYYEKDEVNKMFKDSARKKSIITIYICVIVLLTLIFIYS